jgi:hypothetical protein
MAPTSTLTTRSGSWQNSMGQQKAGDRRVPRFRLLESPFSLQLRCQTSDLIVEFLPPAGEASPQFLLLCAGLASLLEADSALLSVHRLRPSRI